MKYRKINRCQISNSNKLQKILSLGLIPPVNQMNDLKLNLKDQSFFPTELFYCPKSNLVQLGIEVDKKILFPKEYPYTSSTTKVLRDNFSELSKEIEKFYPLTQKDLIIDMAQMKTYLLILKNIVI